MLKLKYKKSQQGQTLVEFAIIAPILLFVIFTIVLGFVWIANWVEWHDAAVQATTVGTTQNASPQLAGATAQEFLQKVDQGVTIITCYPTPTQSANTWNTNCSANAPSPPPTTQTCSSQAINTLCSCPPQPSSPSAIIFICVPQFTTGSGDTNGTASVEIYGWVASPIALPVWGDYLYSNVSDTQTLQVPSGDTNS